MDIFSILEQACLKASKIQLEYYKKDFSVSHKELISDLVTEVDIKSQEAIIESLTNSMEAAGFKKEEIGFIAEEEINEQAPYLFIIDPLDGTSSYVEQNDQFCISIAYLEKEALHAGMVYQWINNTFYFAEKNKGAFEINNGIKSEIKINSIPLTESIATFNLSARPEISEKIFMSMSKLIYKIRRAHEERSVILTIMSVLKNKYSLALNGNSKLWDLAAAKIIVEESGGVLTDWMGHELKLDFQDVKKPYAVIASQKELLPEIIQILQ